MSKIWDIIPPQKHPPKARTTPAKRSKNASLFFGLLIIAMVSFFVYAATKNTPVGTNKQTKTTPTSSANKESSNELLIKVLNGSGRSEETAETIAILENIGFKVTKTESALNLYDQTIVYYEPSQEKNAKEIANSLAKFQAKTQVFSQDSTYDLIIVIGSK